MFNNLFRYSLRSLKRQRSYIIINILGLSIGIACSLLIALFVYSELSFDQFNTKKDRIFRLILNGKIGGQEVTLASASSIIGPTLVKEFPEVEDFLRMTKGGPTVIVYDNKAFTEEHWIEADSSFFNFFSVPVIKGDPKNLLNAPHKAVLSASSAKRIFGDENPIDKTLKIGSDTIRYVVAGVMADIPGNSHFEANILTSFMTDPKSANQIWIYNNLSTYLLLKPNSGFETVNEKFPPLLAKYVGPEVQRFMGISLSDFVAQGNKYRYYLQSLNDIHLDPAIQQEFKEASDPKYLKIFGSIAILIILIAAINFTNLLTAQASKRMKEVGIKKIAGSGKGMLITQFLSESFILTFISLIIALLFIKITLPSFNNLLGTNLSLNIFANWYIVPLLVIFCSVVSLLAGSYPAFFLTSFSPYDILKGNSVSGRQSGWLKRILVVFQFAVSILLIIGTIVMYRQIKFMLNKDVGFNKEQLIVINRAGALGTKVPAFRDAVKTIPGVINVASSTGVPGHNNNKFSYTMEGRKDETFLMQTNWVDKNYLETYGITIASGRPFNESFGTDQQACLINESAVRQFGLTDFTKTRFMPPRESKTKTYIPVIGVVKDFCFESLRNMIGPYIICFKTDEMMGEYLTVKLSSSTFSKTLKDIEKEWQEFVPNNPFQYYFVDEDFGKMYVQEKQSARMAMIFSILAIFIAALGLFGLTAFTVEQRTREIGIRKAMGSSIPGIYFAISKEVIVLVSISALIACPLVYYVASVWLQNFYYRINIGALSFVAGLTIALGIAMLTISYRILNAARINPAQSLKYE
jgi:putative ABC transport system permease protein